MTKNSCHTHKTAEDSIMVVWGLAGVVWALLVVVQVVALDVRVAILKNYPFPTHVGFYRRWYDYGNVTFVPVTTTRDDTQSQHLFHLGEVDMFEITTFPFTNLMSRGVDLVTPLVVTGPIQAYQMIVSSEILSPSDLRGRTLGVQFGSLGHATTLFILKMFDLSDATKVVHMPVNDLLPAWKGGSIDGFFGGTSDVYKAKALGGRTLITSQDLVKWGELPSLLSACRRSFAEAHPEVVDRFVRVSAAISASVADPQHSSLWQPGGALFDDLSTFSFGAGYTSAHSSVTTSILNDFAASSLNKLSERLHWNDEDGLLIPFLQSGLDFQVENGIVEPVTLNLTAAMRPASFALTDPLTLANLTDRPWEAVDPAVNECNGTTMFTATSGWVNVSGVVTDTKTCTFVLAPSGEKKVQLHFEHFWMAYVDMENDPNMPFSIYSGASGDTGALLYSLRSCRSGLALLVTPPISLVAIFKANVPRVVHGLQELDTLQFGFRLHFDEYSGCTVDNDCGTNGHCVDSECVCTRGSSGPHCENPYCSGLVELHDEGELFYTGEGPDIMECSWLLHAPQGKVVSLHVEPVELEALFSIITIFDGTTTDANRILAFRTSMTHSVDDIRSTGSSLLVHVQIDRKTKLGYLNGSFVSIVPGCVEDEECGAGSCVDGACECPTGFSGVNCFVPFCHGNVLWKGLETRLKSKASTYAEMNAAADCHWEFALQEVSNLGAAITGVEVQIMKMEMKYAGDDLSFYDSNGTRLLELYGRPSVFCVEDLECANSGVCSVPPNATFGVCTCQGTFLEDCSLPSVLHFPGVSKLLVTFHTDLARIPYVEMAVRGVYPCPQYKGKECGAQGVCIVGECVCETDYSGDSCQFYKAPVHGQAISMSFSGISITIAVISVMLSVYCICAMLRVHIAQSVACVAFEGSSTFSSPNEWHLAVFIGFLLSWSFVGPLSTNLFGQPDEGELRFALFPLLLFTAVFQVVYTSITMGFLWRFRVALTHTAVRSQSHAREKRDFSRVFRTLQRDWLYQTFHIIGCCTFASAGFIGILALRGSVSIHYTEEASWCFPLAVAFFMMGPYICVESFICWDFVKGNVKASHFGLFFFLGAALLPIGAVFFHMGISFKFDAFASPCHQDLSPQDVLYETGAVAVVVFIVMLLVVQRARSVESVRSKRMIEY